MGSYSYENGYTYVGEYVNGLKQGKGKLQKEKQQDVELECSKGEPIKFSAN